MSWRRVVVALLVAVVAAVLAFGVYVVGALSDWSGQHIMPTANIVGSIALLVVGALIALVILVRGRSAT